jgi:hypothetical protein
LAAFLALSAARFSSLACPPLGLFFSDLALGFGLNASFGGILLIDLFVFVRRNLIDEDYVSIISQIVMYSQKSKMKHKISYLERRKNEKKQEKNKRVRLQRRKSVISIPYD